MIKNCRQVRLKLLFSVFFVMSNQSLASVEKGISLIYQNLPKQALVELQPEIARNEPEALFYAANILLFVLEGENEQNKELGIKYLQTAAGKGYAPALDVLAGFYLHGEFFPQDYHKALEAYQRAADLGYGPSQFNCGIMHKNGDRVAQNLEKAFLYLALAARNTEDLDDLVEDAGYYRDQVQAQLTTEQYQNVLRQLNTLLKS